MIQKILFNKKNMECKNLIMVYIILMNQRKVHVYFYQNFNVKKKVVNVKNILKILKIINYIYLEIIKNSFVIYVNKMKFYY